MNAVNEKKRGPLANPALPSYPKCLPVWSRMLPSWCTEKCLYWAYSEVVTKCQQGRIKRGLTLGPGHWVTRAKAGWQRWKLKTRPFKYKFHKQLCPVLQKGDCCALLGSTYLYSRLESASRPKSGRLWDFYLLGFLSLVDYSSVVPVIKMLYLMLCIFCLILE